MIDFAAEAQWCAVDEPVTLLTRIFADFRSFDRSIAAVAQGSIVVANETGVSELASAQLTTEAFWMPTGLHRLDDSSDDNFTALVAEWRVQNSEVTFAVLATFKFVKNSIFEASEALRAPRKWKN